MKKLLAIILSVLMILSLSACRKSKAPDDLYDFLDEVLPEAPTENQE